MSWSDEDSGRKAALPDNWTEIRREVFAKKGRRCVWRLPSRAQCPRPATDVDHIKDNDDHRISNLRPLCAHHHGKRTSAQGRAAKKAKYSKRPRPAEADPGALG